MTAEPGAGGWGRGIRPRLLWPALLVAATAGMLVFRPHLENAHVALVFLLVVLGGSAAGGRILGFMLAGAAFLLFNYYFLPPYNTLVIANPLDWLVLLAFLATTTVATELLYRAQAEADSARRRAEEIDHLAALGAETLNVGRAVEALPAILQVIRTTLSVAQAEIFIRRESHASAGPGEWLNAEGDSPVAAGGLIDWVGENGRPAVELVDGTTRLPEGGLDASPLALLDLADARALLLPLRVRRRTVGVLRMGDASLAEFDLARWRILKALTFYAALAIERVRLAAEEERAVALREADRLKDALIASVSHDLRTPLTTIKALAHEIGDQGDERAVAIEAQADRLNRMVADLLDLSRLSASSLPLRLELNSAEDLAGAAVQQAGGILGTRRLDVELDATAPVLLGRFDFVHSLRILVNLLENAVKYSPADEPITLRIGREAEEVVFTVEDRGPGVAPGEEQRIFQPFYRLGGESPDVGGAGLGLAISRGLARAQDGTLSYEPRPGGGSRFTVRLPAADLLGAEAEFL